MFRIKPLSIDTLGEHVLFIHEEAVRQGSLGFLPLDRVSISGDHPATGRRREITGVLNFCGDALVGMDEIGLSEIAYRDLGLPDGAPVRATIAPAPHSVDLVREKLRGKRFDRAAFDAILADVVAHRYSKIELSMFVLACALRTLDLAEIVDYTRAMIATGARLDFGPGPVVDKHCIGGIPGNRTTMIVVPILAELGLTVPKTSSRAITSPAGTADTMATLADVALPPARLRRVVEEAGGCIAWGGALDLAPADDILITVERPMELDSEAQMIASILAKKKSVGATHVLVDVPVGPSAKVRSRDAAEQLSGAFTAVARAIDLEIDVIVTEARGPIGRGIGPRLEALDVLAVLGREASAPRDLREKALQLAGRILDRCGVAADAGGYRAAEDVLDSGRAAAAFDRIVDAQGRRNPPPAARFRTSADARTDGRIGGIDCLEIARVAKRAGAPAHPAAGVRLLRTVGDIVSRGEPLFEIHAQSENQLDAARAYAEQRPDIFVLVT
jgi:thymidine phosphorylase